jgi:hypothetical protein
VSFPVASGVWGIVTHFGIWDAVGGGNLLFHGPAHRIRDIQNGDQYVIPIGALLVSMVFGGREFSTVTSWDQRRTGLEIPGQVFGFMSLITADLLLDAVLRNIPYTSPTTVYVGLFVSSTYPHDLNAVEVVGGSYARQAITYNVPAGGVATSQAVAFPAASANWGTVRFWGLFDAASGGNG